MKAKEKLLEKFKTFYKSYNGRMNNNNSAIKIKHNKIKQLTKEIEILDSDNATISFLMEKLDEEIIRLTKEIEEGRTWEVE